MQKKEVLILPKPEKTNTEFQVCWAYPNTYEIGMSGLGYQLIWWLLEQAAEAKIIRAFTNYQEQGWDQCDLFGFTLSWELDYGNVLQMLEKAGIPQLSSQRKTGQALVFGGGPVLSANPEPFADFFDVILIGDAEILIPALLEKWRQIKHLEREDQLLALAQVDGMYVPSLYRYELADPQGPLSAVSPVASAVPKLVKRQAYMAPPDYIAHSVALTPESAFADMFLVEVVRSCPQECRFCLASFLTRPFRAANVDTLMATIDLGLKHTKKIGLLGPSVTEHPQFDQIASRLLERPDVNISVASIRADTIEPSILEMLVKLGQKSVTIALESGSERLRAIMKKNLSETEILKAMDAIAKSGLKGVKLYGIVGLPGETDEDLNETVRLLTQLRKTHKQLRITFGVSSFVPKAQTPFQWSGRDHDCARKLEFVRKHLAKTGIEVRPESHNWSDIQGLLSRGDRRLSKVLQAVAQSAGNLGAWKKALREKRPDCPNQDFFIFRNIPYDETLPWSHLTDDVRSGMLEKHSVTAERIAAGIFD